MSETMKSGIVDRLAYASETPDIGALIEEGEKAQQNHLCDLHRIQRAESERYQFRDGKDGSGQLWQKNVSDRSRIVKPWDGCPDPDASLTDEMCENEVDLDLIAMAMGQLGASTSHTTALTAAQSGALCIFPLAVTGGTFTLPAPVVGLTFDFVTLVSVTTSSTNKVITNASTVFLTGGVAMASLTAGGNDFFEADGTSFVAITMDATTKGGLKGGRIRVTCISSTLWQIEGVPVGSGTLADPFTTT